MTAPYEAALSALASALAAALLLVLVQRTSPALSPVVELARQDWRCTSQRPEPRVVQAPGGPATITVYGCDQWSRW